MSTNALHDPQRLALMAARLRKGWLAGGLAACNAHQRALVEEAMAYRTQEIERLENALAGRAAAMT